MSILGTGELWATHYAYMNDSAELNHAVPMIVEIIADQIFDEFLLILKKAPRAAADEAIRSMGGERNLLQEELRRYVTAHLEVMRNEVYILSFCGQSNDDYIDDHGLLDMWRCYGPADRVAIEFDTKALDDLFLRERNRYEYATLAMSAVVYSNDDAGIEKHVRPSVKPVATYMLQVLESLYLQKDKVPDSSTSFQNLFISLGRIKHHAFQRENEVRIIAVPGLVNAEFLESTAGTGAPPLKNKRRHVRHGRNGMTPFIKFFDEEDTPLPLKRIIVGPQKNKKETAQALRLALNDAEIPVEISDIPFIG